MAVTNLCSLQIYTEFIRRAGFTLHSVEDLTAAWAPVLRQRRAMYRRLREEAQQAATPAGHDAFYASYVRFVDLVSDGRLGGGCFISEKPR
jgi:hypothetical protein